MGTSKMVMVFLFLLLVIEGCWRTDGCLKHERSALFQLKHFFYNLRYPLDMVDDGNNSDCCQWEKIVCNIATGRIITLDLASARNWKSTEKWYLNASLFTPFQHLEHLDLSDNMIAGCVENEGLERLSKLSNLKFLDLGGNYFNNSILSSLGGLSSLKELNLYINNLKGSIDLKEWDSLSNLERLNMRWNKIDKFEATKGLSNLKILELSYNNFNNSTLSSFGGLSSLRELYLYNNNLKGNIDIKEWDSLRNLEHLDMSYNEIDKFVAPKGLSNLKILELSYNNFNNSTLSSLGGLSSLRELYLYNNSLKGNIDIKELDSLRNLKYLDMSFNEIDKFEAPKGLGKLEYLDLHSNKLNNLSFLTALSSLRSLNLYENGIKGSFDVQELDFLSNIEELNMGYNEIDNLIIPKDYKGLKKLKTLYLDGVGIRDVSKLLKSMESFPSLKTLSLLGNNFTETVTITQDLHNFTNLEELELDGTSLHISLLRSIAAFSSLKRLSMDHCALNGGLPTQGFNQISKSMASLQYLSLSSSSLNGTILDLGLCELVHLQELYIQDNDLRGSLPWCLANMTSLRILDVSFNQLTGNISSSPLMHLSSIELLTLSNNQFQIPISLEPFFNYSKLKSFNGEGNKISTEKESQYSLSSKFQLNTISLSGYGDVGTFPKFLYHQHNLEHVDLSHLNLTGEFPFWLLENNTKLKELLLVNNSLTGSFQMPNHSHISLRVLDVSINKFQGHIPVDIGDFLTGLYYFNISKNAFTSSIPASFGNMKVLTSLDLSNNQLSGEISEHLAMGCSNLEYLVLSNNNLEGHIFSKNFNLISLLRLELNGNQFIGEIPKSLSKCIWLEGLYLSDCHLSGKIPRWLGNLSSLQHIILPKNHLEGPIPIEFCQLDYLQILDISYNKISGSLPSCFNPVYLNQVHLSNNMLHGQLKEGTFFNSSSLVTLDLSYNRLNGSIPDWVDRFSFLSYLILAHNNLEGEVPIQLCRLNQLQLIDLSHNNLSGHIPHCLHNTTLHENHRDTSNSWMQSTSISWMQITSYFGINLYEEKTNRGTFEFTTKNIAYIYQGIVVSYMSGLDLSCNKLVGEIPPQIGNLTGIKALNLSHNDLTGSIPPTFSNLKQIESLDLSYNELNGEIPYQLVELNALAVFSVAHNNLSGKTPEFTEQFATFNESSYEGNPFLCGKPLPDSCNESGPPPIVPEASTSDREYDNLIDMDSFYITFTTSYVIAILGFIGVLCVNPYWRCRCFYLIEIWMNSSYYYIMDNLIPKRFCQ